MVNPYQYLKRETYKLFIGGEFYPSESGETFDIINPATNEVMGRAFKGGIPEANKVAEAARKAADEGPWKDMTPLERSRLLWNMVEILNRRKEEFACLESLDTGKIYPCSYDIEKGIDGFAFYAGEARTIEGKVIPVSEGKCLNYRLWQPYGVIAEIIPWNGPFMMGCQKVAAILAAGNAVIIKPSSWASLSILELSTAFQEAGFPPGVVNIITGPGSIVGEALVLSPQVDFVSMTGGTETGRRILELSSKTIKNVALELGGKSPNIVFEDVDLDSAAAYAVWAFTMNQGQICVAGTRLIVQDTVYEKILDKIKQICERFKPGNGFDPNVNFGPIIHPEHAAKVWSYIESGKKEGARLITGGEPYTDPTLVKGNFIPPTVFADVTPKMRIFQEEIFGPVLAVSKFHSEEEAIDLANATKYGLAGAVFTSDIKRAHRVVEQIKSGQIYINTYYSKGICESPGCGWKESGIGGTGIYKYMHPKTVFVDLSRGKEC